MHSPHNIFLVGPMGVGKTTIGRLLARRLHLKFIDLDEVIEETCGAEISWIFDVEGEEGFRRRESVLLENLTEQSSVVLATGGGVVKSPVNRSLLAARGTVVYLEASVDQLFERTRYDKKRPLLQVDNPRDRIATLLKERDPLYREIADIIIPTEHQSPQAVASIIEKQLTGFLV